MLVDEGAGGLHQKVPFYNHKAMNLEVRILVVDFGSKSYKRGGSVIPHLEDAF
jgi:hypothetical protein